MISKKIAMIGAWGVGKTSLVRQYVDSVFSEKYHSTIGVKVDKKVLRVDGQELTMVLWDIAGAEEHFSVPLHYVKGAAGYLLAIDGTRRDSLNSALDIVAEIEQGIGSLPFIIVANKSDLDWELSNSEIDSAFAKFDQQWLATSAKSGENVEAAFAALARRVMES
ncbi:MAG: small GTP-binding protein [Arenicella sp.]|jgi:small GTP-binding protein